MDILQPIMKSGDVLETIIFFSMLFFKVTFVFLLATIATLVMKRGSAAARHLVWTLAFCVVLIIPLWMLFMPALPVSVPGLNLSASGSVQEEPNRSSVPTILSDTKSQQSVNSSNPPDGRNEQIDRSGSSESRTISSGLRIGSVFEKIGPWFFVGLWGLGIAAFVLKQIVGRLNLFYYSLRSTEVTDPGWAKELRDLQDRYGIVRPVRLLQSDRTTMIMTWGWLKPRILIPCTASNWTEDHRRFVLMHEMAHIRRLDTFTQLLAQVVLGLYWFHPLTWTSRRSFFKEREHACDDFVLQQGSKPSEYAGLLLDIARTLSHFPLPSAATVSMARKTQLEGRLLAILNAGKKRHAIRGRSVCLLSLVSLCLVVPLAALQPARLIQDQSAETPIISAAPLSIVPTTFEKGAVEQATEINKSRSQGESQALLKDDTEPALDESNRNDAEKQHHISSASDDTKKLHGINRAQNKKNTQRRKQLILSLSETLQDPDLEVRIQAAETLGRLEDEASVDALITALNDERTRMRLAVVEALGNIESRMAVDPLIRALKDEDWRIRSEAASALGDLGDERAVDPLAAILKDEVPDVRMEAVDALSDIEDDRAVSALIQALSDEEWEIRKEAAYGLGDIGDHHAVDALILRLQEDIHWEVKMAAVESLGDIEDRRAIPALIEGTRASRWEIRKAAVEALDDIGDPSVIDALIACFRDSHAEVRRAAVEAAGELENSRAVNPLMAMMDDQNWEIRKSVIGALMEIDDPAAVPMLIARIGDEHREVRMCIIEALGELEARSAVEPLIGLLDHPEWEIREVVVEALGEIGDPRSLDPLTLRLKDAHEEVRKAAAHALGDLKWRQDN